MSQTLSSLPQSLKDFQKNSGISKRAGRLDYAVTIDEWNTGIGSEETLLDNWTVIGCYIGIEPGSWPSKYLQEDAMSTGLPVYQVTSNRSLERIG